MAPGKVSGKTSSKTGGKTPGGTSRRRNDRSDSARRFERGKERAERPANVLIVAGPTASGKSALALRLAEELDGTVINADSLQLYRDLSILTSRPGREALARAPHRLYGILAALEPCSAGRWSALAVQEMRAAFDAGRLPILVGGTGMYLKALTEGLAPVPPVPPSVRDEAKARMTELGPERFHAMLGDVDPEMARRVRPSDRQRLMRAFEVMRATGRSLASFQAEQRAAQPGAGGHPGGAPQYVTVVLDPPRDALYAACDARFDAMMREGALDEARRIEAMGLPETAPVLKALGLRDLIAHLRGEIGLEEAVASAKQATRNYAKRQVTWFRHQARDAYRFPAQFSESLGGEIFSFIRKLLLTPATPMSRLR